MYPQLPAGLDPVQAGRFGLWLLGQRSHVRKTRRCVSAVRVPCPTQGGRFAGLFVPWTVHTYPSATQAIAELCGVKESYAEHLLSRQERLPAKHAATLGRIARERAEAWKALADELEGIKPQGF